MIYNIGNQQWNTQKFRELLEDILPKNTSFDTFEVEHDFPHLAKRIMILLAVDVKRSFDLIKTKRVREKVGK